MLFDSEFDGLGAVAYLTEMTVNAIHERAATVAHC